MRSRVRVMEWGGGEGAINGKFAGGGNGSEAQIATARRFPRDAAGFREDAGELVALDEATARACVYALPRGGRAIAGPSVRFAEIVLSCWGNARASARIVAEEPEFVVARGEFHDVERNTEITCETKRRIIGDDNRTGEDTIATRQTACSLALRDAILRGVPQVLWRPVYEQALGIIAGDAATLPARLQSLAERFLRWGVNEQQLAHAVGARALGDVGVEGYAVLEGLANAIADGGTTVEAAFHAGNQREGSRARKSDLNEPPETAADAELRRDGPGGRTR